MRVNTAYNKERKRELVLQKKVRCGFCAYHQNENAGRKPLDDKYKNKREKTNFYPPDGLLSWCLIREINNLKLVNF